LLDETEIDFWKPITVKAGQTLKIGQVESGCRTYLAVRDGLDVPLYLGSRSTFALGNFGGHAGRTLRVGDMIKLVDPAFASVELPVAIDTPQALSTDLIPEYGNEWEIGVLYGPHGAPDFFKPEYIEEFFASEWTVHFNSNRLGVRLSGPTPSWARENGGEAGLHPSNVHDCEYAIGAINFTGDFPVILAKDGPSLGGFVCPVTIAKAELWKVGQLKADDKIRFYPMSVEQANALELKLKQKANIENFANAENAAEIIEPTENVSTTILASNSFTVSASNFMLTAIIGCSELAIVSQSNGIETDTIKHSPCSNE